MFGLPFSQPAAKNNVYEVTDIGLVRLGEQSKGKSKATDITDLFMWTGWVSDEILDISGDGNIDSNDVPLEYDLLENGGDGDGIIGEIEFNNWLDDQETDGLATYYENEWILNMADLVVTDQTISNDGVKLLKIRFYPVESTTYQ